LILDYLQVLVWPAVVVAALLLLRDPLRKFIREMEQLKVSVGAAALEASRRAEAIEKSVEELVAAPKDPPSVEDEGRRRKEIADLVNQSVRFGWELHAAGGVRPPITGITWGDDGKPIVTASALLESGDTVTYPLDRWGEWEARERYRRRFTRRRPDDLPDDRP